MHMGRITCLLSAAVLAAACGPGGGELPEGNPGPAGSAAGCTLTMGWDPWEPYLYQDIDGTVRGLDVELVSAVAERCDCALDFRHSNWGSLLDDLRAGDVDVLAGATRTSEREGYAFFTDPYRAESFRLYVRNEDRERYAGKTLAELVADGLRIGYVLGYAYGEDFGELADDREHADQFLGVSISEVNYEWLLNGTIDVFLDDPVVASTLLRKKDLHTEIVPLGPEINRGEVSLMLSRISVDDARLSAINACLREFRQSEDYRTLMAKYRS